MPLYNSIQAGRLLELRNGTGNQREAWGLLLLKPTTKSERKEHINFFALIGICFLFSLIKPTWTWLVAWASFRNGGFANVHLLYVNVQVIVCKIRAFTQLTVSWEIWQWPRFPQGYWVAEVANNNNNSNSNNLFNLYAAWLPGLWAILQVLPAGLHSQQLAFVFEKSPYVY